MRGLLRVQTAANTSIVNSFIGSMTHANHTTSPTTVTNCVFMDFNQATNNNNTNVLYRNNVFLRETGNAYGITEQSTFLNNLWVVQASSTVTWPGAFNQANNEFTNNLSNVFVNNTSYSDFAFDRNYHLVPGGYQTMGVNGTQVGVYGGSTQSVWKDGALPFNPHWQLLEVPLGTSNGILQNVHIKGSAQTH